MEAVWSPQIGPQTEAISATWCQELFFGGSRGGGKSDFLLGDFLQDVWEYANNWHGILFRRTHPELDEIIRRSHELFPETGAEWLEGKKRWKWPNGASLKFRHMENDRDAEHYRGHQYGWIGFDELDAFPSDGPYRKLRACNRWAAARIPTKRMRSAGNPGGAGHSWIKEMFIDQDPLGYTPWEDPETKRQMMFIPARVYDNKILMEKDPDYINALRGVGSPALVKAWLDGDFNAVVGSYFPEFGLKHIVQPFEIPAHWTRFRAIDWGSYRPFVVQWMTLSDGTLPQFPVNSIIVYREWYGGSKPNVGLKLTSKEVADGIKDRQERNEQIAYTVIDPAADKSEDGPSTMEKLGNYGIYCHKADNSRIVGWQQVRDRLRGEEGVPRLYIVGPACPNLVRTLPILQHDKVKPEDVDTESDDHCADTLRYGCVSRPYTPSLPPPDLPIRPLSKLTYEEVLKTMKRQKGQEWRI